MSEFGDRTTALDSSSLNVFARALSGRVGEPGRRTAKPTSQGVLTAHL